jgi:hypothetical protein
MEPNLFRIKKIRFSFNTNNKQLIFLKISIEIHSKMYQWTVAFGVELRKA